MDNDAVKEEIRRLVRIEDVVSQHVPLQRAGSRLKACCPFHQEKTPSFYVNPELGLYKCFGCGVGGDVFDFVQRIEHVTFPEAAERLAERVGLEWNARPTDRARTKRRQLGRKANEIAAAYFEELLWSASGKVALDYLHGRGFTDEIIRRFKLGYALDAWDGLLRHLRQQGIDPALATEAGLAKQGSSSSQYDVFRHRVMFPIIDGGKRVIGFGGRALSQDDPAKYLNTPETATFKKGRNVYALNLANTAITQSKQVVVVEGYTDVMALHQAGIENVVACLGTALTQDHLDLLSRHAEEIVLAYDADAAGMSAAARNIPMLEAAASPVYVVRLPEGLDPDECVKAHGAEGFLQVLANRTTPVEYEIDLLFSQHRDRGPDGVSQAAQKVIDVLLRVPDRARQDEFLRRAADLWGEGTPGRTEGMQQALKLELSRRTNKQAAPPKGGPESPRDRRHIAEGVARLAAEIPRWVVTAERDVLRSALAKDVHARVMIEALSPEEFFVPAHRTIAEAIAEKLESGTPYDARDVLDALESDEAAHADAIGLAFEELATLDEEVIRRAAAKLREYRHSGKHRGAYEVPSNQDAKELPPIADFEALRKRVAAKLNSGDVDPEDPDIALFRSYAARAHGGGC